jgi:starch-binding outer membrane protein, SusD/RagB family
MKIKLFLLILSCVFLLSSCKKYLDVIPVGQTIPTKVSEYDALLDNQSLVHVKIQDKKGG